MYDVLNNTSKLSKFISQKLGGRSGQLGWQEGGSEERKRVSHIGSSNFNYMKIKEKEHKPQLDED